MAGSDLFSTMGIRPLLGRVFDSSEDATAQRVAVLSEALWRRKFGADPAIAGRQIRLGADSIRVIGILPQRQTFPEWADLWIPLSLIEPELQHRGKYHSLEVVARLKPGVEPGQAQIEMQTIARRLSQDHPDTNETVGAYVISLAEETTGAVRPSLLLAWAAVALVLLMACANLAHMFLARLLERRQELRIREALGARPAHLIRQVMTEGFLVAGAGGAVGLLASIWMEQVIRKVAAGQIPRADWIGVTAPVWLFAAGISVVAAVLFALPACSQMLRPTRTIESGNQFQAHSEIGARREQNGIHAESHIQIRFAGQIGARERNFVEPVHRNIHNE